MKTVSVRAFSYNPSAMFAEVERGETIEVTKHGKVIAVLAPPPQKQQSRYEEMVEQGLIIPAERGDTPVDWSTYPRVVVPDDVDPLAILDWMRQDRLDWMDEDEQS